MGLKYPNANIIQITYNNMLKREVRKKVNRLCIGNMHIHTYHSLTVNYYDNCAYTDEEIKKSARISVGRFTNERDISLAVNYLLQTLTSNFSDLSR